MSSERLFPPFAPHNFQSRFSLPASLTTLCCSYPAWSPVLFLHLRLVGTNHVMLPLAFPSRSFYVLHSEMLCTIALRRPHVSRRLSPVRQEAVRSESVPRMLRRDMWEVTTVALHHLSMLHMSGGSSPHCLVYIPPLCLYIVDLSFHVHMLRPFPLRLQYI